MTIKTLVLSGILSLAATGAFAQSAFDSYNAKYVNTPEVKSAMLRKVCASSENHNFALCQEWTRNGVPDGDIRVGIIAAAGTVGAGAGMVAATVPMGVLGGNTLVTQWGITSIAGWAPTAAAVGTAGALIGAGAAAVATR